MATRHAPSISQYSFAFPPPSPLPESPTPDDGLDDGHDDPFEDAESVVPPHSRWGSDGTFGGRGGGGRAAGTSSRSGVWREFAEDEEEGNELAGDELGQGRERAKHASSPFGHDGDEPEMIKSTAYDHRDDSDHDSIILPGLAGGRIPPHISVASTNHPTSSTTTLSAPARSLPVDQMTVLSDRTYASSIASSASGWIVPAPQTERSDERSMLDLGDGSDEDETEAEDGMTREERLRAMLEEEEEERQEREWLAWRAGGEPRGAQGWNKDKGSKLDRVLGEGAPLPLSAYSDVLSGPGTLVHTESSTSTATVKPPNARTRQAGRGHVVRNSIDSGQSYLSLDASDDEGASQHSVSSPFFFAEQAQAHSGNHQQRQPIPSTSTYRTNSSRRTTGQQSHLPSIRASHSSAALRSDHPSRTLSLSSLTPEEKARLLRRAKKLESRLGVTLTGDLIAGSLTRPPPAARGTAGGRRASDPERVQPQSFAGRQWSNQSADRLGSTREGQSGMRSRGKATDASNGHSAFSALGFGGSTSYVGGDSHTSALRPRTAQRSSLPASPSATEFRSSLGFDSPTSPTFDQTYPAHSSSHMSRSGIPRHHLDRLKHNSSTLSLPASLAPTHDEREDSTTHAENSPISEVGFPQPAPWLDARGMSDEDLAIRRLRMIRLSKIHHVLGGEVPQEQLVDGPGTGPWLEPSSDATHSRTRTSSGRSDGTDSETWKDRFGRVRDKVERSTSEIKGKVGTNKGEKEKKVKGKDNKAGEDGATEGEQTSFLSLEAGELPEVSAGTTSRRGLKLNKLFGDIPAPNLYHQAKKQTQTITSPTSSFYSTHNDHPSSTSLARVSTNTTSHRSSTEVLDFLRD